VFNRLIFSLHSLMSRHGQVPELMFPVCSVIFKPECAIRHEPLIMSRREKSRTPPCKIESNFVSKGSFCLFEESSLLHDCL